jgi:hypothetical protein
MLIEIWNDNGGEWCKMFVDGVLFREDHSERAHWWHELINGSSINNVVLLTDIDIQHKEYVSVKAVPSKKGNGWFSVYTIPDWGEKPKFLGYVDSVSDYKIKYNKNGRMKKEEILIDVIEVDE